MKREKPPSKIKPLTTAQQIFCRDVVLLDNQSEAYRQAYPKSRKWKPDAVWSQASRLAADPRVAARIQQLREYTDYRIGEVTIKRIEQELARIAFYDSTKTRDASGKIKKIGDMDEDTRRALVSIDETPIVSRGAIVGVAKRVRTFDKLSALQTMAKIKRMGSDDGPPPAPAPIAPDAEIVMPADPIEAARIYKELLG